MRKIFIYSGILVFSLLMILYLAFLFVLPNVVDLKQFVPEIQKIVKEQADIDLEIENPKISTNWLLQAGLKTGKISAKLPDGSTILDIDGLKVRISLPNLLFLTVKASCVEINSPKINLEIINGEQFKVVRLVEDILNKQKNEPPKEDTAPLPIDISKIKYKAPNVNINNYSVVINDLKTKHTLTLKGEKLKAGYNNGKFANIKTIAQILSDDNVNVKADIDFDTFIPPATEKDLEGDNPAEKIELPFINPVLAYRDYDLKSDINAKLKIRQNKHHKMLINGNFDVDNTTVKLSGLQLPKSYIKSKFNGDVAEINTNLVVAPEQEVNLYAKLNYGNNPFINLNIFTDKIYFNDLFIIAKAYLDTAHINNNLANIKANGYWTARANIKTDFKKLKSEGSVIARNGSISNSTTGLVFDKIRANIILKDNKLEIDDTNILINGKPLNINGIISTDAYSDIKINSEKLPLPGLFMAFAPSDLKKSISLTSGDLSVNAQVVGELKTPVAFANILINNLGLRGKDNTFIINNEKLAVGVVTDTKTIDGNISDKNFRFTLPSTNSNIRDNELNIKLTDTDINILPSEITVNNASKIVISGDINNYSKTPDIQLTANGSLNANDLKKFAGESASPFIEAAGNLPLKAKINGNHKKQSVVLQVKSDSNNYITPVDVEFMHGKPSILQAKIDYKGDKLNIKKTGFYTGIQQFTDDLENNLSNAQKVIEVSGTIVRLKMPEPFINLIKVDVADDFNAKFTAFKNSSFRFGGDLIVFGKLASPIMRGNFKITDLRIPEILTSVREANVNLSGKDIILDINRLLLNGSDINLNLRTDINPHPVFTITRLALNSNLIDLDKLLIVPERLNKYLVPSKGGQSAQADIPILMRNGTINIREIKTGNIVATDTTGRISLSNNDFYLNNLNTHTFDGKINGDITVNLISMLIGIQTNGTGLNVEKALFALSDIKDTLSGTLSFDTDLTIGGNTVEEMMKNLKGDINLLITDGQLGPFGKLENMILAENIRESQFFQTALGGVINNLTSVDTSHFKTLEGLITFDNGIAHINPIKTTGTVMSIYIAGDFDLLKNTADMKVRAKLGSVITSLLGPLAQLNPVNLVQATPGMNVVMAKTFFLFCETLTPEETALLPQLEKDLDDKMATKFQIVLKGDVSKPLTLIKSFKWLALASEIEQAENFVNTLPDPSLVDDPQNATLENIMQAQEEKAKEDAKITNKIKRFFSRDDNAIGQ